MTTSSKLLLACSLLSVAWLPAGCGDDGLDGQGGGGGAGTSSSATDTSSTDAGATTTTVTATGSTSQAVGTGGAGGDGGAGGSHPGAGGGDGEGGNGEGGEGGGAPICPEQPAPYVVGERTKDACADLAADADAPAFHVEFIGELQEPLEYDGSIAIDFAFPYVLSLPLEDLGDFTLTESRCQTLAGDDTSSCSEGEVDISELDASCSMRSSGRFGIDPGNVHEGINTFDFTMTLRTGCAEVSDTFTLLVDYQPAQ